MLLGFFYSTVIKNVIVYMCIEIKEGNVLFSDTFNTFYLRLHDVRHIVMDHSDSKSGNLVSHGLLFLISSKGSFKCIIPHTG